VSSYEENNYRLVFEAAAFIYKPKVIVEFGVLHGYSLDAFLMGAGGSKIYAYDIFDDFPYNHANYNEIKKKYASNSNIEIRKTDFFDAAQEWEDKSIDLLHVDIANDGRVYEEVLMNWISKTRKAVLIEGGGAERDNIDWMIKYNKSPMRPIIETYKKQLRIHTFEQFPSLTLIDLVQ